jgi:predicted phosphodiesterase
MSADPVSANPVSADPVGLLFIGDPHLADRPVGFRRDDYPAVVLGKLRWCLEYSMRERLLPVVLGDLFHYPRDNGNRLLTELFRLLPPGLATIAGNHDCSENTLCDADTLAVLAAAGRVRLLDDAPWTGTIHGATVSVGGTSWGRPLPERFDRAAAGSPDLVFWATHHDLRFAGYEDAARHDCREIPGIDAVVNGHIHRRLDDVIAGCTRWMNPGNIARVRRGDAGRGHVPGVLRVDVSRGPAHPPRWRATRIALEHRPFEEVFHPEVRAEEPAAVGESLFVRQLAQLESLRTAGGEGLQAFLDANLGAFDPRVAAEIRSLWDEVRDHEPTETAPAGD